jgi:hypothetical protein
MPCSRGQPGRTRVLLTLHRPSAACVAVARLPPPLCPAQAVAEFSVALPILKAAGRPVFECLFNRGYCYK